MNICGVEVSSLEYNSKNVVDDSAFFAIEGHRENGNDYVEEAIENGAKIVFTNNAKGLTNVSARGAKIIEVKDVRKTLANMSCAFYNNPSEEVQVIGITGTKGKTSVTFMIKNILETAGIKTGIIGTVMCGYDGHYVKSSATTPQSVDLQKMMRQMVDAGCKVIVMEVSSQGLMHKRVEGVDFNIGVFTNISPDHIGEAEHKDFDDYYYCKSHLLDLSKRVIINGDVALWREATKKHKNKKVISFGKEDADLSYVVKGFSQKDGCLETTFDVNGRSPYGDETARSLSIPLPGEFNVENALAAISVSRALGVPWDIIEKGLKSVKIPGRAERVEVSNSFTTMVDYAHNGVALKNLLLSLKKYEPNRLVVVFGCGGNRDKNRRFEMGRAAYQLADCIIVTSDNPRNEEPQMIIEDITSVMSFCDKIILAIPDRKEAIRRAIEGGRDGDIIVIAGKGHETYQIIGDKIIEFDDREAILSCRKEQ